MAPIGAAGGSVFPGFFVQLLDWKWLYFFLAMVGTVVFLVFALIVPGEPEPMNPGGHIDYLGGFLGVTGLILFNFVWNQAPVVGRDTPYIYILLIVSILVFAAFVAWEWKGTKFPILPLSLFQAPTFSAMIVAAFLTFMSVGIVTWYITVININIRHYTIFEDAASYATLAVCGACAALLSAVCIRVLPAQAIMVIGSLGSGCALILVATSPAHQTYWAQFFPALMLTALGPDFLFTASQIVASNSVSRQQQGVAGSFIGTLLAYGLSTGLGFAGTVDVYTKRSGKDELGGHRRALWLGVGFAFTASIVAVLFVRIPKDTREGWDEEKSDSETRAPVPVHRSA
ncbi:hypothetical protein PV08_07899 [Exophiala spinifera]|uniref:Major facilitator superfamily (MFS) profile domain-containing protein n=1 Tax=Exophiala spinifera TaxID=91928 RepID=A0A0D1ZQP7_9EURO|nr:uncharacterized protein PV08_07899 [Exophiala spinifera]KIW15112.1 hypothetical protein PV08_07899 [Exophiala spinifera]